MKLTKPFIALLLIAVLSGCASSGSTLTAGQEPSLRDKYVTAINRDAQSRASRVYWVNYPTDEQVNGYLNSDDSDGD